MRRPALALLAAVALGLTACGQSDQEQIRETLDRFQKATAKKDYQALCDDVLASAFAMRLRGVGLPCEVGLQTGLGDVRRPTLEVTGVEVAGDEALARVNTAAAGQRPSSDTIKLVKEDDEWRIASLAAPQPQPPATTTP